MDYVTIKGAYEGLSFARKAFEVYVSSKADAKAKEKVGEALERLGTAQDVLCELRDELGRLQDENRELGDRLRASIKWDERAAAYTLTKTSGGALVMATDGPTPHFACPVCFEKRELHVLQDRRVVSGIFECPNCKADYPVNPRRPLDGRGIASRLA